MCLLLPDVKRYRGRLSRIIRDPYPISCTLCIRKIFCQLLKREFNRPVT